MALGTVEGVMAGKGVGAGCGCPDRRSSWRPTACRGLLTGSGTASIAGRDGGGKKVVEVGALGAASVLKGGAAAAAGRTGECPGRSAAVTGAGTTPSSEGPERTGWWRPRWEHGTVFSDPSLITCLGAAGSQLESEERVRAAVGESAAPCRAAGEGPPGRPGQDRQAALAFPAHRGGSRAAPRGHGPCCPESWKRCRRSQKWLSQARIPAKPTEPHFSVPAPHGGLLATQHLSFSAPPADQKVNAQVEDAAECCQITLLNVFNNFGSTTIIREKDISVLI